jgi:mannosyltransferase OCH1-like enzyme
MIPKIIWQTHEKPYEDLKPFQKDVANTWKNLNPGWEYRYVESEEREQHIKDYNETLYKSYILSDGINQADLWRIVITYQYGGFYADMDSICRRPIDEMINEKYKGEDMISSSPGFQTPANWVNNSNFAVIKNSKIMKSIIDKATLECKTILDNEHHALFKNPGVLVWHHFCNTVVENRANVCFDESYFYHSKDYKKSLNLDYEILYNGNQMIYSDLVKMNKWAIHQ